MKILILKIILFIVLLAGLFFFNLYIFRSDWPLMWLVSTPITIGLLVIFPYNKYFKIKSNGSS